jgi:hypothetical protein
MMNKFRGFGKSPWSLPWLISQTPGLSPQHPNGYLLSNLFIRDYPWKQKK